MLSTAITDCWTFPNQTNQFKSQYRFATESETVPFNLKTTIQQQDYLLKCTPEAGLQLLFNQGLCEPIPGKNYINCGKNQFLAIIVFYGSAYHPVTGDDVSQNSPAAIACS